MSIVWVLEPQDVHSLGSRASGWEMGPQCVTRVGVGGISGGVGGIGFGGFGVKTGGKRVVFSVLEPQDVHRWEMGPQCVTWVGVVASWGGSWSWVWGVWGENWGKKVIVRVLEPQDVHSLGSRAST